MTMVTIHEGQVQPRIYRLTRRFNGLVEDRPGDVWRRMLGDSWGDWRDWYVLRGGSSESRHAGLRALRRYMPEIENLVDKLASERPEDPWLRDFLGFWCPPRYLVNCTQAVSADENGPFLIRNYDLDPFNNEAKAVQTNWRGKRVVGMAEGMAGLSDGMNQDGLAISLTYGGRVVVGRGFGIPLIMRYVLEVCSDVKDGVRALRSIPSHMSYNVTLADKTGDHATVFLSPGRPTMVSRTPWATNHQIGIEWPRHGRISATLERASLLTRRFRDNLPTETELRRVFTAPPVFSRNYRVGFGTVFTSCYRPASQAMSLTWGDGWGMTWNKGQFTPHTAHVEYTDAGSRVLTGPAGPLFSG